MPWSTRMEAGLETQEAAQARYPVVLMVDELLGLGGTEMHLVALARSLKARGHRIEIWTFRISEALRAQLDPTGVPIKIFPMRGVFSVDLPGLLRRVRMEAARFGQGKPFVLQSYHIGADLVASLLAPMLNEAVVISTRRDMGFTRKTVHDLALRALGRSVKQVLVVSEEVKWAVSAREGLDPRHVQVIHNGVDTARFHPARTKAELAQRRDLRGRYGCDEQSIVAVSVGSFQTVKGQGTVIRAFARMCQGEEAWRSRLSLFLVGGREYRLVHERFVQKLGLAERIHFLGERGDVDQILRAGDLFVLPSWSEGFSNALLEAMSTGLPVVTTQAGGARAAVSPEMGVVVPAGNPARMRRALESLCVDDAHRAKCAAAARRRAIEVFDLERMVQSYQDVHRAALARQYGRRP